MGVTIFYSGTIKEQERDPALQKVVLKWAKHWKCDMVDVVDEPTSMVQLRGTELVEYDGPMNGFVLYPHPEAESLAVLHGTDGYCWRFCKTQFAGPETHLEVVRFLREIEPFFTDFQVKDEGKYWETGDRQELERRMGVLRHGIDSLAKRFPKDTNEDRTDHTPRSGKN